MSKHYVKVGGVHVELEGFTDRDDSRTRRVLRDMFWFLFGLLTASFAWTI